MNKMIKLGVCVSLSAICGLSLASSLKSQQDKLSYSMGYKTGQALHSHQVKINADVFASGLSAGMKGSKSLLTEQQMKDAIVAFQKNAMMAAQQKMKTMAVVNQTKSEAFLKTNKAKKGVKVLASGLQYKVVTAGTGSMPTKTDTVTVDYEGKLVSGKVFDSSYKRGKPAKFQVGAVIAGWTEALQKMKEGATWDLYIPSKLAYGMNGPSLIGPNQALVFKVHLIKINKPAKK